MLERYIHLDSNQSLSLQNQIKSGITQAVASGFVDRNEPVTSSRKLAKSLNVSRNTVLRVYEQLSEEGFFIAKERSGYYVNPEMVIQTGSKISVEAQPDNAGLNWHKYFVADSAGRVPSSKPLKDYPYLFVHGMVDDSVFPVAEWRKCSIQSSNRENSKHWTSTDNDYNDLVEQIRTRVLPRRGIFVKAEQIMVTLGSQQSLYLISRLLTSKRTRVGLENPGYPEAYAQLSAKGAKIAPLDIDDKGLVIDESLGQCDIVYTTPGNQFPTTVRMPYERRSALLEAAEYNDFLVIEDDFEHDVNYLENDTPAMKGEFPSDRIIYLSSFSSTIAPGLRIGFMVAAEAFIQRAKQLQQRSHSYPPQNNCQTLALFIALGYYDSLMQKLLKNLRNKWLTMEKALNYYFPQSGVVPSLTGTAFWINYKQGFDSVKLARLAEQKGILFNSGEQYYFKQPCRNGFRLSFNSIDEGNIRDERNFRQIILNEEILSILEKKQPTGFWANIPLMDKGEAIG
ncbi:PLP-dependent aminotransferase family protein, partial [Vibrio sp.]|uniref:aminotransferase-like domain-containing protein n=1 Tax=Vibrio sp. TaxID=678 RepID=UPI003D129281